MKEETKNKMIAIAQSIGLGLWAALRWTGALLWFAIVWIVKNAWAEATKKK